MKYILKALIFLWPNIIDIIYPKECVICGKADTDMICNFCYSNLKVFPIINKYNDKFFSEHLYIFKYEGTIRKIIIDYKFNDKSYLNNFFLKIILKNQKICRKIKKYDIIIPVPIHSIRKKQRGYNQSELVAKGITKNFDNIELITNVLIKQKNTVQQSSLNLEQRIQNVKQVYYVQNIEKIKNKKIILFDDIYTTGATCNECARLLKENGAKEILIFTIAKD